MIIKDGLFNKKDKNAILAAFFEAAGYSVSVNAENTVYPNFVDFFITKNGNSFVLHASIRNISNAYLKKEPTTKRRQVEALDYFALPPNKKNSITILIGLSTADDELIVTIWNAFHFCKHKTVRSCYVTLGALEDAAEYGLSFEQYGLVPSYSCKASRFSEVLSSFIERFRTD